MRLTRRTLLGSIAAAGVGAAFPGLARADDDPVFGIFGGKKPAANAEGNTATAKSLVDTIEPILSVDTAYNLSLAIENYEAFVAANGSWDMPSRDTFGLAVGKKGKGVYELKRRLMINGDMAVEQKPSDSFDDKLDAAVRLFQARHGLIMNGQVDEPTYYALSVPADYRLNQLKLNAQRIQQWSSTLTDRYVVVNIPAASIEAVEGSQVIQRHTAVVGKVDRATPIMNSKINQVKFNPTWTVPKSIIEKDLIAYMNEDPEYLTKFKIHIYDGKGREVQPTDIDWSTKDAVNYTFRQEAGAENSMGHCKIDFYNPYDCYLHDTPQKGLFAENTRFHSSGCVRVDEVDSLVAWLLRDNGGYDLPTVDAKFESNESENVPLKVQVPLHTTYITAWANRQGTVSFRDDVYNYDAEGRVDFSKA